MSRVRAWLVPALVGVLGAAAGLWLLPASSHRLGPTTIALKAQIGSGQTALDVTPFGTLSARTHLAPLDVTAALRRVDIEELGARITSGHGRADLRAQIEGQIPGLLRRAAATHVITATFGAGLLGAAVLRRRRSGASVAAASGLVFAVVLLAGTAMTYEQARFAEATYSGSLARARQVIEIVTEHTETLDQARSRYEVAARRASELMILLAHPELDLTQDTTAILHISDLHANPVGLEITQQLAQEFGVAGVIDTGDLASSFLDTGELSALEEPVDRLMVEGIRRLAVPYLFIPGNHDSPRLRAAVARAANATVLSGETASIAGIEVLGWADPTYSTIPMPEIDKAQRRIDLADDVASVVAAEDPDVLAVHDAALAGESTGSVPLVVSGHFHRRIVSEADGTRFLAVGSTGSTGVKSLTVEADLRYEAEVLYFDDQRRLVAVDYVTLKGLGEDFVLERNTFTGEPAAEDI